MGITSFLYNHCRVLLFVLRLSPRYLVRFVGILPSFFTTFYVKCG
ncbi:peptidase S41 [Listeria monocytogenes]|nr:peptidase S41 [Listeria monocytogenes]GAT40774.1 peptidase S41 [Listeria monocytogenes]